MNKLKLMILSFVLLASQLNGLKVHFLDQHHAEMIDDRYGEIFVPKAKVEEFNRESKILLVKISRIDFAIFKDILLKARMFDIQIVNQQLNEKQIEEDIINLISLFRDENSKFIGNLRKVNELLRIRVLQDAIERLEQAVMDPDAVRYVGLSQQSLLSEYYRSKLFNLGDSRLKSLGTRSLNTLLCELSASVSIKISVDVGIEEDGVFTITKGMCDLSKTLKTILEVSETQDTINVPNVNIVTMRLLIPLWKSVADLSSVEMTDSQRKAQLEKIIKDFNFTLEQLDILLGVVNFLDIKVLFEALIPEIGRRLLTPEATNLFRLHPERFNFSNLIHFNFSLPELSRQIAINVPQVSLLDGLWRVQNVSRKYKCEITSIAVMLDGRIVVGFLDGSVRIINIDGTIPDIELIGGHTCPIGSIAVMPDGRIVTGDWHGIVRIWTINTAGKISSIELIGHADRINCIAVMSDGRIVTGSSDKTAIIWTINAAGKISSIKLIGHDDRIISIAIMSDGRIVTGSLDCVVNIWTINDNGPICSTQFLDFITDISTIAVMPNDDIFASSNNGTAKIWSTNPYSGMPIVAVVGHTQGICSSAVMPGGRIITGSRGRTLRLWTINSAGTTSFVELKGNTDFITSIVVTSDGHIVTLSCGKTVSLWNNISTPNQLTLEQILFINAFKQKPLDCSNPEFHRIFASLDPRIQSKLNELVKASCSIQ